ncbi:MAG: M6 family metalloprotease domain-containing protein [Bacteroidales bacterium]|nr:M6 family metalloprotease domain-containing protein [Bacteroidales bacterium]
MNRNCRLIVFLLLAMMFSASAAEDIHLRPCRMGKTNPELVKRRALSSAGDNNPYIGERRQLVVLASFQDRVFVEEPDAALAQWERIFNEHGLNDGQYVGSVHDYFYVQSAGQFNLSFDLKYVALPDSCKKYRSTYAHDEYSQYMVDDIVDALMQEEIDWSLYDWDDDQFVDQLLILYAGKGMNDGGGTNSIWPHQWWLSQHEDLTTADHSDFRSYRTVNYGDVDYFVDSYCCVQEVVSGNGSPFGTLCHEYSHCFGFPDFYYGKSSIVGAWDLMDYGCYNGNGFRPCNYSAHERMLMGWLEPIELTEPTTVTDLPALGLSSLAYMVRNDGAENECYIIENRQQEGWDADLPGSGILVFHVDYDKDVWLNAMPNDENNKRYSIFPANNNTSTKNTSISQWAYPYIVADMQGNDSIANNGLTNDSRPVATLNNANLDGGLRMSKPISKMAVDANGLASFVFMDTEGTEAIRQTLDTKKEADSWYTLEGRKLQNAPSLPGFYIRGGRIVAFPFK